MTGNLVVLDVGKTLAKLTLWSADGELRAREVMANRSVDGPGYRALATEGIAEWIAQTLREFATAGPIEAIIPVGHGAAVAIVRNGALCCPPMDYEQPIPQAERERYEAGRDAFSCTGSPALPGGLNLGVQLHYLESLHPGLLDDAVLLTWPQYWGWRLSGVAASEVSALGCHTDLWSPAKARPSPMAIRRGWADRLPPLRGAGEVLGGITREWASRTGLSADTLIYCGLHDSNAALLAARGFAEIAELESTVLSTGTWFVAMRTPGPGAAVDIDALAASRDCLVNVDVFGRPIPSSRFMGGREIETLTGIDTHRIDLASDQLDLITAAPRVLSSGAMVLPTFAPGCGPFPRAPGGWVNMPGDPIERRAAVCLYTALVADASLDLIGARERLLVEGRFAEALLFVRALAALRPDMAIYTADARNDLSYGAVRLLRPDLAPQSRLSRVEPLAEALDEYRQVWRDSIGRTEIAA